MSLRRSEQKARHEHCFFEAASRGFQRKEGHEFRFPIPLPRSQSRHATQGHARGRQKPPKVVWPPPKPPMAAAGPLAASAAEASNTPKRPFWPAAPDEQFQHCTPPSKRLSGAESCLPAAASNRSSLLTRARSVQRPRYAASSAAMLSL